jgi:hypothetical protein
MQPQDYGLQLGRDVPEVGALRGDWIHIDPAYPDHPARLIRRMDAAQTVVLLAIAAGGQPWEEWAAVDVLVPRRLRVED